MMASHDSWLNVYTDLSQGSFGTIHICDTNGNFVNLLTLLNSVAGGIGSVASPLSVNGSGVLGIDLSSYALSSAIVSGLAGKICTSHICDGFGISDVDMGEFDLRSETITLGKQKGVTILLSCDNGAHLLINGAGVITVSMLNLWNYHTVRLVDSGGNVRLLNTNLAGALIWDGNELTTTTALNTTLAINSTTALMNTAISNAIANFTTTAASNTLLGTYSTTTLMNTAIQMRSPLFRQRL